MRTPTLPPPDDGRLAVLLATFNGAEYLEDQLRSIADQDWPAVDVYAADDGSSDRTRGILQGWAQSWTKGTFRVFDGPRRGPSANFRFLMLLDGIDADYVAFSDQDDIWLPGKAKTAAAALAPLTGAALFGSRTFVVDAENHLVGRSSLFRRQPNFRNALIQSICGGNTMVLNREAFELVQRAARLTEFVAHDWFAYQIVSGAGGQTVYCREPLVRYRQHGANVVGSNGNLRSRVTRVRMLLDGRFAGWNERNLAALDRCADLLTPQARDTAQKFSRARRGSAMGRLLHLLKSGVYRQTLASQVSLYLACLAGKI